MKSSGGGGLSSSPPAAAAVPPAAGGSLPRCTRTATAGEGGGATEVPETELTQVTGGGGREPGASRPLSRARGWLPSGSSGRALPGAEHGAGRRGAAKAAPEPAPLRAACVCQSFSVFPCQAAPWWRERPRLSAAALATAPLPRPIAAGCCQLRGRRRPLTPGLGAQKAGAGEGGGERAGGGGCSTSAAPLPARGRACPWRSRGPPSPPACAGPPPGPSLPGGGERRGPPGVRHLSGTRKLQLGEGRGGVKRVAPPAGKRGLQGLQPALFLNFCLNYL